MRFIADYADLHVHSYFSDGSMSPAEIIEDAKKNRVGLLSVTDHNTLEGGNIVQKLCQTCDIHYIPAVEIDSLDKNRLQHILAYGFDHNDTGFIDFINHSRFLLDEMSVNLIDRMKNDHENLSLEEFFEYKYNKQLGGWKGLHYLLEKGITSSLTDGIRFYPQYDVLHSYAGFSSIAATIYRIKKAGGYSVLAHPGEMFDTSDIKVFKNEIKHVISYGIDGIECYYPKNSNEVTQACLEICDQYDLLITAGSDCHGTFTYNSRVGEMDIPISKLHLKDLYE